MYLSMNTYLYELAKVPIVESLDRIRAQGFRYVDYAAYRNGDPTTADAARPQTKVSLDVRLERACAATPVHDQPPEVRDLPFGVHTADLEPEPARLGHGVRLNAISFVARSGRPEEHRRTFDRRATTPLPRRPCRGQAVAPGPEAVPVGSVWQGDVLRPDLSRQRDAGLLP